MSLVSYSTGIFRVKCYICFDFKFAQKGFDGPLDPQQFIQFPLFPLYKPVLPFLLYLFAKIYSNADGWLYTPD